MGFRFQKRLRILPGITLNLSKSGVSASVGVRGARITRGHGKTRVTVGVPGSGISHTTVSRRAGARRGTAPSSSAPRWRLLVAVAVGMFVFALLANLVST